MPTQATAKTGPAPKTLTLKRETLRRLTPAALRLVAGGLGCITVPPSKGTLGC
jgi:hypothetical protein